LPADQLAGFQQWGMVHEGIHFTGFGPLPDGSRSNTGERSVFDPVELGSPPLREQHQDPYNNATKELLEP
jgi:hypothetical protein